MENDLLRQLRFVLKEELEPIRAEIQNINLEIQNINLDIKNINGDIKNINDKFDRIEKKIDITYDQVARTAEDGTIMKKDLSRVEEATASNCIEIAKLKAIKS